MARIVLNIISSKNYLSGVAKILKKSTGKNVVYVTTNNIYTTIQDSLKKEKVNSSKIFFVDCVSKSLNPKAVDAPNCIFVEGAGSLSSISIAINAALNSITGKKILFFDSLSVLLLYQDANTVARFSSFVLNKMRSLDVDAVILALDSDAQKDVLKHIESLVDEVIHGGK